jgi:hypothetical protein
VTLSWRTCSSCPFGSLAYCAPCTDGCSQTLPRLAITVVMCVVSCHSKLPGIGKVTEKVLNSFGIQTCGELLARVGELAVVLTPLRSEWLLRASLGDADSRHHAPEPRKSLGCASCRAVRVDDRVNHAHSPKRAPVW